MFTSVCLNAFYGMACVALEKSVGWLCTSNCKCVINLDETDFLCNFWSLCSIVLRLHCKGLLCSAMVIGVLSENLSGLHVELASQVL